MKPGDTVTLRVDRGVQHLTIPVKTIADPQNRKHVIIGFAPEQAAVIKLPLKVQIDAGNVGGPSAGLAFALEVLEDLGHRIDRGYKVAATGEIELERRRRADRRDQAEDVRRAGSEGRCLPRACGKRGRRPALRAWPADHRCEEFSPGVARAGNPAPEALENGIFRQPGNCRKFVSFRLRQRLLREDPP